MRVIRRLKRSRAKDRYLVGTEEYRKDSLDFIKEEDIALHRFDLSTIDVSVSSDMPQAMSSVDPCSSQDPFTPAGRKTILDALSVVLDTRNHPMLIHDDMGKSTCTLLCSLIRRIEGWSLTGIYAEGDMFAGPAGGSEGGGVGEAGREFIALFNPKDVEVDQAYLPYWAR